MDTTHTGHTGALIQEQCSVFAYLLAGEGSSDNTLLLQDEKAMWNNQWNWWQQFQPSPSALPEMLIRYLLICASSACWTIFLEYFNYMDWVLLVQYPESFKVLKEKRLQRWQLVTIFSFPRIWVEFLIQSLASKPKSWKKNRNNLSLSYFISSMYSTL